MKYLLSLFFALSLFTITGQTALRVNRSNAIDWSLPVNNLFVDEDNNKWVANDKGVFQVLAYNLSEALALPPGTQSLLALPGGNAQINWSADAMANLLAGLDLTLADVTAAHYQATSKMLWLGTEGSGLVQIGLSDKPVLIRQLTTGNSKLRSDVINSIFEDRKGRLWVASADGALVGKDNTWELIERYFNIEGFAENDNEVWMFGDGFVGPVNSKMQWNPKELPAQAIAGVLQDLAFDWDGNIWLASEIIARYAFETTDLLIFDGASYYTSSFPVNIVVDLDGAVWVSTLDKGLFVIEESTALNVRSFLLSGISCDGNGSDASIGAEGIGGEPPYSFEWSNGGTEAQLNGVPGGNYRVVVTDAKGQVKSAAIEVVDPRVKLMASQLTEESTSGAADGVAAVDLPGQLSEYRIQWSNGATTPKAEGLVAGDYEVTVSHTNGCSAVASVRIKQKSALLAARLNLLSPNPCTGASAGVVEAVVTGGTPPYQLTWAGANTTRNRFEGLSAGTYVLEVQDAAGERSTAEIVLTDPEPLIVETAVLSPAGLDQNNGAASITVSGGTPDYTFIWDNGSRSAEVNNLSSGSHEVTVTDQKGCSQTAVVEIPENILPLSVALSQEGRIRCAGEPEGGLSVKTVGGKGPMQYVWNDGSTSGPRREKLAEGRYSVTVTDANGATAENEFTITGPPALEVALTVLNPASVGQANGRAALTVTGGVAPYAVVWDNGQRDMEGMRLMAGQHNVSVTDKNNCTTVVSFEIPENVLPLAADLVQTASNNCPGEQNVALDLRVTGGKEPYSVQWNTPGLAGFSPKGLRPGEYTATVTDATGSSATATLVAKDAEPVTVAIRGVSAASTGKADGKASAVASGGDGNYTFRWDNGVQGVAVENLSPGEHKVIVTDGKGCTAETNVTIRENILPLQLELVLAQPIACNGDANGGLTAKISGGKEPYAVQWSNEATGLSLSGLPAGRYAATVTDASEQVVNKVIEIREAPLLEVAPVVDAPASANQSNGVATAKASGGAMPYSYAWSNGSTTATLQNLAPGTYEVTVTDAAGCKATSSVTVSENVLPLELALEVTKTLDCFGDQDGAIEASVKGGKLPLVYAWSNGSTTKDVAGLGAGDYELRVTDASGQQAVQRVQLLQPEALTLSVADLNPASANQNNGSATILTAGGTAPYRFSWSNGDTASSAKDLPPGNYEVQVTDDRGCIATTSVAITEDIKPLKGRIALMSPIDCAGNDNGAIRIIQEGGKAPFTYAWNREGLEGTDLKDLGPGEYAVTLTDAAGTALNLAFNMPEPQPLEVVVLETRATSSPEAADGKAEIQIRGGTAPFKIRWQNGEESLLASRLAAGNNLLTILDAKGCRVDTTLDIKVRILTELIPSSLQPGQTIRLRSLEFEADSSRITPQSIPVLEELYGFLKDNAQIALEVGGHTNNIPPQEYCDSLSTARAKAVAAYLVGRGIATQRVQYYGYGKRNPIFSNQTEDGRQRNQRVEIKILRIREED